MNQDYDFVILKEEVTDAPYNLMFALAHRVYHMSARNPTSFRSGMRADQFQKQKYLNKENIK